MMKGGGYDADEVEPVVIDLGDAQFQVPWARTTFVLGTKVDDQGDAAVMVEEQLRKAMGSLYADKDVFFCTQISFGQKVRHYVKHVIPVALHGCGAWIARQGILKLLHGFETRCLKRMLGFSNSKCMDWVTWHRCVTNRAKELFFEAGNMSII